jgi:hypothetical protein
MRKVVDGKLYDTEKATMVAEDGNGLGPNDFKYEFEELYVTQKGAFFLYGEGGPLSSYSEIIGNGSCGSCEIKPLDKDEAYDWLERYNKVKAIQEYFSDRIEEA